MSSPAVVRRRARSRLLLVRALVVLVLVLGVDYLAWRWLVSVNWAAWPIAVPLVLAETYSFVAACLFGLTVWRPRERGAAPAPAGDATIDVVVTTRGEPVDLVMATALAAQAIRWPHATWVLDHTGRDELRTATGSAGIGYLTGHQDQVGDEPRRPDPEQPDSALVGTRGELLLLLAADQVPTPAILHLTAGWFRDPSVALVHIPRGGHPDDLDVLEGRLQQGRDGWNAAFRCGSNAMVRREALRQTGVVGDVREDIGTAVRLHTAGWRTVYHPKALAAGAAPRDSGSVLHERLHRAQGTLRVLLRQNPLVQRRLSVGQRLMYLATMWTYLSGFAALVYLAAPVAYLVLGVLPVTSVGPDLVLRLVPLLVVHQVLVAVVGWRATTSLGRSDLALFPLWIRACTTAVADVAAGRTRAPAGTALSRQPHRLERLMRPQLVAIGMLLAAAAVGLLRWGQRSQPALPTAAALAWVGYEIVVLALVVRAVRRLGTPGPARVTARPAADRGSRSGTVGTWLPGQPLASRGGGPWLGSLLLVASVALVAGALVVLVRQGLGAASDPVDSASGDAVSREDVSGDGGERRPADRGTDSGAPTEGGRAPEPPRGALPSGVYVRAVVTATGDVQVREWIRSERPLFRIALALPATSVRAPAIRATDVVVAVDGTVLDGRRTIAAAPQTLSLHQPTKEIFVAYTLRGAVERSPSSRGRALIRATALEVRPQTGPSELEVSGHQVLNAACWAKPLTAPRPCGAPFDDGWRVVLRGSERRANVVAQVNLS